MLHSSKCSDWVRQNRLEETGDCTSRRAAMEPALVRKSREVAIEGVSVGKLGTCSRGKDAESVC